MKYLTTVCLTACLCVALSLTHAQTVYRVNNTAGSDADFTDLQTAISGVVAGDVLIIEHSNTPYNVAEVEIDIQLEIYGTGFFLLDNPGLQADTRSAKLGPINITAASVEISGFEMEEVRINGNGVVFERNLVNGNLVIGDTNPAVKSVEIKRSYLKSSDNIILDIKEGSSHVISNNLIWNTTIASSDPTARTLNMSVSSSALVTNNIFYGDCPAELNNVLFNNNVFQEGIIAGISTNVTASNNYAENPFLVAYQGLDNIIQVDSTYTTSNVSRDRQFELRTDIPNILIGGGSDGSDASMYGGAFPYVVSGIPKIPSIYFKEQEGTSEDGEIDIEIRTRTNK